MHVTPPELDTIEVTPYDAALILSYVVSILFNANGYDKDGNEIPITPTWSTTGGEISPDGLYTATEVGDFIVTVLVDDIYVTGGAYVLVVEPKPPGWTGPLSYDFVGPSHPGPLPYEATIPVIELTDSIPTGPAPYPEWDSGPAPYPEWD